MVNYEKRLRQEILEYFQKEISTHSIERIEIFVENFQEIYKEYLSGILKQKKENPYFESPCADCLTFCNRIDRVWYCKDNT